jgi:hypothetical protein
VQLNYLGDVEIIIGNGRSKMKKKTALLSKPDVMMCWRCDGTGWVNDKTITASLGTIICPLCSGSGKWVENHYIVIDNKNNIAIDSDTGG